MRVYTQLHDARPVLLNLRRPGGLDAGPWADHVRTVDASYDARCAPSAVQIRPDGYVARVGQGTGEGLVEALTTWFGPR